MRNNNYRTKQIFWQINSAKFKSTHSSIDCGIVRNHIDQNALDMTIQ